MMRLDGEVSGWWVSVGGTGDHNADQNECWSDKKFRRDDILTDKAPEESCEEERQWVDSRDDERYRLLCQHGHEEHLNSPILMT